MYVIATAGHVDHGKSTLVQALTGMQPDRWDAERRRGLTIDLGFVWTTLPSGRELAFVDVPGHQRFLGNMLAGIGPAPVVCFVVAADEGWQRQSSDHRDAVAALDIRHGLVVLTRTDRAGADQIGDVRAQVRRELAETGLHDAPMVAAAAVDGTGMDAVRGALDDVLAGVPDAAESGRLRLWVDRSFSVTGAGTVVTGTLTAGTIAVGDRLKLSGPGPPRPVIVRGLQSRDTPHTSRGPVDRVALNLRGIAPDDVHRGDVLLTPDAWPTSTVWDVRRVTGPPLTDSPGQVTMHAGTAAVAARMRPFDDDHARLMVQRPLPLVLGDRLVLHAPGTRQMLGGAQVLDADPPALRRRGDGSRRVAVLHRMTPEGDVTAEVARRGAIPERHLRRLGVLVGDQLPDDVLVINHWWVHSPTYRAWQQQLSALLRDLQERDPLSPGLSRGAAVDRLELPTALLDTIVTDTALEQRDGYIRLPGHRVDLGPAEAGIAELERRLTAAPFDAPTADDLTGLRLGSRELAAAERAGRILRLGDGVVLLPTAPARAMHSIARLDQPFTTSQARQTLDTTRRIAIPLLEHLDANGWTRRIDAGHRIVTC